MERPSTAFEQRQAEPAVTECKRLPESLNQRLAAYASAAVAAGVGILALAQPAEAGIISSNANLTINLANSPQRLTIVKSVAGFEFTDTNRLNPVHLGEQGLFNLRALHSGTKTNPGEVARLASGQSVGPGMFFTANPADMAAVSAGGKLLFNWPNQKGYLGFDFTKTQLGKNGSTYFGFVCMSVTVSSKKKDIIGKVTGWAYESTKKQAIVTAPCGKAAKTPEPGSGSLELLALGAAGLLLLRNRRRVA